MYWVLLALIVILMSFVKTREHLGLIVGGADIVTTDGEKTDGYPIFNTTPNTCPKDKPELDAGLCYPRCKSGFHGVGPVCWADSRDVGVGQAVGLEPCPKGWSNDGLICREPIWCDPIDTHDSIWPWNWTGGGCHGGRLRGRLDNGGICDWPDKNELPGWLVREETQMENNARIGELKKNLKKGESLPPGTERKITVADNPDYVDGLCYAKCPPELPARIPGMPYLCYKGDGLSYGRGAGAIPSLVRIGRSWNPF